MLARWKKKQEERKVVIAARREEWEKEKVAYEQEKAVAKLAKKRFVGNKLVLGKLPAVIPRPKVCIISC